MKHDYLDQTFGLAGRVALVTGAARGLGFAIARGLGMAGAQVVINDLSQAACEAACARLGDDGIQA
ncbi:MAG: SDR family NAD(P)-dependent oxidoreductase, partial [Achromobacter pestifer]